MELDISEIKWINNNPCRCPACGHLEIFHNDHCCTFCLVDGCECEWGELPEEEATREIKELFATGQTLCYSDIAERLDLNLELVVQICNRLQEAGEIEGEDERRR